ncbi:HAD family phosphatase, partial [Kocuria oceani]
MTTSPHPTTSPSPAQPGPPAPAADWSPACVVFDCDGILMDTEANWARVQRAVAQRHGLAYTDAMERAMMGWSAADVATA